LSPSILERLRITSNRQYPTEPDIQGKRLATAPSSSSARQRLDSWKEIAAFFGRDERTVNRWEKEKGLPVHRLPGAKGRVYAYADELSQWLENSRPIRVEPGDRAKAEESLDEVEALAADETILGPQPVEISRHGNADREGWTTALPTYRWMAKGIFAGVIVVVACLALALPFRFRGNFTKPRLTEATGVPLKVSSETRPAVSIAHDPEAEQFYLKGRYYWNKRTPEDLNKALDFFTQAVVHDPNYAPAYIGMADCYNLLREYTMMRPSEAYPRALAAAKKAVELDDQSSEAHASLAFALFFGSWDLVAGEREFKRAIELNANNAVAHHWYASALSTLRRFPESLVEINRAQALDTSSTSILADKGHILLMAGREDEGVTLLKQMESTEPAFLSPHRYLRDFYLATEDYPDFLAESKKDAVLLHDSSEVAITQAAENGFAAGGKRGMLQGMRSVEEKLYRQGKIPPSILAQTCALMDDQPHALQYLKAAYDEHEDAVLAVENYTAFNSLHGEPAYRDLISKLHLPAEN
jgi:tetratricopeptide (TPR) repeat protein